MADCIEAMLLIDEVLSDLRARICWKAYRDARRRGLVPNHTWTKLLDGRCVQGSRLQHRDGLVALACAHITVELVETPMHLDTDVLDVLQVAQLRHELRVPTVAKASRVSRSLIYYYLDSGVKKPCFWKCLYIASQYPGGVVARRVPNVYFSFVGASAKPPSPRPRAEPRPQGQRRGRAQ